MRRLARLLSPLPFGIAILVVGSAASAFGTIQIEANAVVYPLALARSDAEGGRYVLVLLSPPKNCDGGITTKPVLRRASPRGPLLEDPAIREVRCRGTVVKYSYDVRPGQSPDYSGKGLVSATDHRPVSSRVPAMTLSFMGTNDLGNFQAYLMGEQSKPAGVDPIVSRSIDPAPEPRSIEVAQADMRKAKPVPRPRQSPKAAPAPPTVSAPPAPVTKRQPSRKPSANDPLVFGLLIGDAMTDAKLQRAAVEASDCDSNVQRKSVTQRGPITVHSFACPLGFGGLLGRPQITFWIRDGRLDSIRRYIGGPVRAQGSWDCYGVENMYEVTRIVAMSKPWTLVRDGHWERPAVMFGPVQERWRIDRWGNVYVHQFHNGSERNETCGRSVPEKTWIWTFDSGASGAPPGY